MQSIDTHQSEWVQGDTKEGRRERGVLKYCSTRNQLSMGLQKGESIIHNHKNRHEYGRCREGGQGEVEKSGCTLRSSLRL